MRIRVQVLIESDQETIPLRVEEVACFEREQLTPETLGLQLSEAKQVLAGVQHVMTVKTRRTPCLDLRVVSYLKVFILASFTSSMCISPIQ